MKNNLGQALEIEEIWKNRDDYQLVMESSSLIGLVIEMLNYGQIRVAEQLEDGNWKVNEWVKKAILLYFKIAPMELGGTELNRNADKIPLKFANWSKEDFTKISLRVSPGAIVRFGSHIVGKSMIMPSFVNIGAFIDESSMLDTWCSIGSCAQIGKNCHISAGAGIGGVLEPLVAKPTIIEDGCFIGARSEIVEGVIIRKNSVIAMGVYISASTKIIDRQTGEIFYGEVPENSVVVPGSHVEGNVGTYAAVIVKEVDERTKSKVAINQSLRDNKK